MATWRVLNRFAVADDLLRKLRAAGFEVVPVEATEAMIGAGDDTEHTIEAMWGYPARRDQIAAFWRAMVRAAGRP